MAIDPFYWVYLFCYEHSMDTGFNRSWKFSIPVGNAESG